MEAQLRARAQPISSAAFSPFGELVDHSGADRRHVLLDATSPA